MHVGVRRIANVQALREVERQRAREKLQDAKGTDVHYLKNVVLKLYETGAFFCCMLFSCMATLHLLSLEWQSSTSRAL